MSTNPISEELAEIIRNAVVATANRPASRRGPYVFDEEELTALATSIAGALGRRGADSRANQAMVERVAREFAPKMVGAPNNWTEALATARAALSRAEGQEPEWMPPSEAPKDGTLLRLLVVPDEEAHTSFHDSETPYETIGFNQMGDTGDDQWQFAGWDWSHDCITQGYGDVIGWLPFHLNHSTLVKAPAPVVPDGWKLVPVEPIAAMKAAAFGPVIEGGRGGPITKDFLRQEIGIRTFKDMLAAAPPHPGATHRHKKRGEDVVLIGIGKMQTQWWFEPSHPIGEPVSIDMRPVAIYQSTDDGSLWARPIEEWEDGRFEALDAPSQPQAVGENE